MIALWEKQIVPHFLITTLGSASTPDCTQGYCLTSEKARSGGFRSFPATQYSGGHPSYSLVPRR